MAAPDVMAVTMVRLWAVRNRRLYRNIGLRDGDYRGLNQRARRAPFQAASVDKARITYTTVRKNQVITLPARIMVSGGYFGAGVRYVLSKMALIVRTAAIFSVFRRLCYLKKCFPAIEAFLPNAEYKQFYANYSTAAFGDKDCSACLTVNRGLSPAYMFQQKSASGIFNPMASSMHSANRGVAGKSKRFRPYDDSFISLFSLLSAWRSAHEGSELCAGCGWSGT